MIRRSNSGSLKIAWGIARGSPKLIIGASLFLVIAALALLEPVINRARLGDYLSTEIGNFDVLAPPSWAHPFGTDHFGRDLMALLLTGLRNSMFIGVVAGALATALAVILATVAAYKGGRIEALVTTISNSILIIPSWPILAIIVLFVENMTLSLLAVLLAFFSWSWPCRTIMPQIASLKERPYIDLARVTGFSDWAIMLREILPNFLPYIVVAFSSAVTGSIVAETGLRLVGLGPGGLASLGMILNWAVYSGTLAQGFYMLALSPIVLLVLIFLSLNFVNVGLDEVYNPRLKRITGL